MSQKTYIIKTVLGMFIASMSFVFAISPLRLALVEASESSAMTGTIDASADNKVKVCKDVTCEKIKPGIIDFNISSGFPLVIDTENGLSGKVFGDEMGWIIFDGGVFFDDPSIGVLEGIATSEKSGAINFSVTGQKVIIDPITGEWNGWAWASGPYGGWIKFDCKNASCVRTLWKKTEVVQEPLPILPSFEPLEEKKPTAGILTDSSSIFANLFQIIKKTADEKAKILAENYSIIASGSGHIFLKTIELVMDIRDYISPVRK